MKKTAYLKTLLFCFAKGIVTGMAMMIPGGDAGSMVMSLGMYEPLMVLLSGAKAEKASTLRLMLPFGAGMLGGIFLFAYAVKIALANFPFQTSLVFIGLILGGVPMLARRLKGQKIHISAVLFLLLALGLMAGMVAVSGLSGAKMSLEPSFLNFFVAIVLGFLGSITMILPGVSGSALMLISGYYYELTDRITQLGSALLPWNGAIVWENLLVFVPFLVGVAAGMVLFAKVIRILLEKYPVNTHCFLIGLLLASPLTVLTKIEVDYSALTAGGVVFAVIALIVGFCTAFYLSREE